MPERWNKKTRKSEPGCREKNDSLNIKERKRQRILTLYWSDIALFVALCANIA